MKTLAEPIKKNKLPLLYKKRNLSKVDPKIAALKLHFSTKPDLLHCIEALITAPQDAPYYVDVAVLDGAAIVQMQGPGTSRTFQEYVDDGFKPYILRLQ